MGLMDALGGWLKQIIAVVLLAAFVDLLLPNRAMQRYVRLVAGLFILLTVLSPLLGWLKGDFGEKLSDGLVQVEKSPDNAPEQLAMIEREGEKLRDRQGRRIADLAEIRLAEQIRTDVALSEGRPVKSVEVQMERTAEGAWAVKEAAIVLEAASPDPKASAVGSMDSADEKNESRPIAEVESIAPVEVAIHADAWPNLQAKENGSGEPSAPDRETRNRIAALVAARYGIAADSIVVTESGAGAEGTRS